MKPLALRSRSRHTQSSTSRFSSLSRSLSLASKRPIRTYIGALCRNALTPTHTDTNTPTQTHSYTHTHTHTHAPTYAQVCLVDMHAPSNGPPPPRTPVAQAYLSQTEADSSRAHRRDLHIMLQGLGVVGSAVCDLLVDVHADVRACTRPTSEFPLTRRVCVWGVWSSIGLQGHLLGLYTRERMTDVRECLFCTGACVGLGGLGVVGSSLCVPLVDVHADMGACTRPTSGFPLPRRVCK